MMIIGPGGFLIIGIIVLILVLNVSITLAICQRYNRMGQDLLRGTDPPQPFRTRVLNRIVDDARKAREDGAVEINTQAIIEHNFQTELGSLLLGERFGKSATGLTIILGLVGTFYGLTLSITKLVALVSGEAAGVTEITQSVTKGLTEALSGMSIAFSTSLFGIGAAIIMTVIGIFWNIPDRREAVMIRIEHYLDNLVYKRDQTQAFAANFAAGHLPVGQPMAGYPTEQMVTNFGRSVDNLNQIIARFDSALQGFAATTRDFREFNLHLKDNVQRMSLGFGDLSDTLKDQIAVLKTRDSR
jgi:methyl-accepting chemotaxis protein